jgi:hypothetical protein
VRQWAIVTARTIAGITICSAEHRAAGKGVGVGDVTGCAAEVEMGELDQMPALGLDQRVVNLDRLAG